MQPDWVAQEEEVVISVFRSLRESGYGRLEILIREGHVETIHKTETSKIPDYRKANKY